MGACARILMTALFALGMSPDASAQTAYAPGQGSPNSVQLTIPVTASVRAQCGFATVPSGTHDEPNFDDHAWSHDFGFTIDCSTASRIAVVSANGALLTGGVVPGGYATTAPYNVTLNVAQNVGAANGTCAVANLTTGGSCTFVGPSGAMQGLAVAVSQNQPGSYLRVSAPAYAGANVLTSGNYTDTLVVTLSPSS